MASSPASATKPLLARAALLLREGRPGDAIAPLAQAAALLPSDAAIQHDLGLACLDAGRPAQAAEALRQATQANPRYADAWFRLGIALEALAETSGAIAAYHQATALRPGFTQAWFRAGALVFTLGHRTEAIACFRRAASSGPKTVFGRLAAARALLAEDRDVEAERALRRTLALDPANPIALDLLGNLLADAGQFDAARDCFTRAIAGAPLLAGAYYDLVRCRRVTTADTDLPARMQAALATPGLDSTQRLRIHLAIGKAADDLDDCALAMRHFDAADAERRATAAFDAAAFGRLVDRLITRFTPELIAGAIRHGNPAATPVLITGLPRSGTTLVEQILSSHPDVAAGGELAFWGDRGAAWFQAGADAHAPAVAQAATEYLAVLRTIGPRAVRVTDKMPFNILWAGLIHIALPAATIIHCRRADIDTALSIHQTHFNPHLAFPTGGAELVAYIRATRRLAEHWRRVLPPERFVEIGYEALTAAPEPEIRRLASAAGLAWNDACLAPEHNARAVKTPSRWQARQPIYRTAVDRWRRYDAWLGALRPLLQAAGDS